MLVACGKDSPLQPEPEPPKTPDIIPLAEGSSWEYSVHYHHYETSQPLGFQATTDEYGQLQFNVIKESLSGDTMEYELKIRFRIDSLHFNYSLTYPGSYDRDTVYTQYKVADSTYYYTIGFANDTLWYKSSDSLYLFMPDSIFNCITMNLELFATGRYRDYFRWNPTFCPTTTIQESYEREWNLESYEIIAKVKPSDGGIDNLNWHLQIGYNSGHIRDLLFRLIKYTPGSP